LALVHGLLYVWLVPPWQTPDEPTQFEYAALVATLGHVPGVNDADPALEERIAASLARNRFFEYLLGRPVVPAPRSFEEIRQEFFMPRQVGADPPLYFLIAAMPIRLLAAQPIETQLLSLRLLGAGLVVATVLCVYGAARELRLGSGVALAAGLAVALQPMFVFIGVGVGNDGLANLLGAVTCWLLLRIVRCGTGLRHLALLAALLLLGVLTKRTLLPAASLCGLLVAIWLIKRGRALRPPVRASLFAGILLGLGLAGGLLLARSRDVHTAADWNGESADHLAQRVLEAPESGTPALELHTGRVAVQALPDVTAEWIQNWKFSFSAHVWTGQGKARGRLVIDNGWAIVEQPFQTGRRGREVQVQTLAPLYAPYLHVQVRSDDGTIYADRLIVESDRRPGMNLLSNGTIQSAGLRPGTLPAQSIRFLRLRELGWLWHSGRWLEPPPLGWDLARVFFASFWGQFGWMSLPLVGGTPWEKALGLICLGGILGTFGWMVRADQRPWRRHAVGLLLALVIVGLLLPLLNAYIQPRSQAVQQGRYLFSALAPLTLLLVLGWRTLLPRCWRFGALATGAIFGVCFSGAALRLMTEFYLR
jgi:hypothetical protein